MHGLVEETHWDLIELIMLEINVEGKVEERLPLID